MGSNIPSSALVISSSDFNPHSPHGERLGVRALRHYLFTISTHAPRRGSDLGIINRPLDNPHISIHAPRRGSDKDFGVCKESINISIHAPRRGSDSTVKAYSNDRIKWSTLREPHFLYSKNACFSPIVSMCAATSRTKKSENQSFIRIISRLGTYVFHLRLVSVPQIIEPYAVRLLVHQHFQCGTK